MRQPNTLGEQQSARQSVGWKVLGWRIGMHFVLTVIGGQVLMGEQFYGVFLSESLILCAWGAVLACYVYSLSLPRFGYMFMFLGLCVAYLTYSMIQQREIYWVFRQGAFMVYMSVAVIAFYYTRLYPDWYRRWLASFAPVGALLMVFHKTFDFDQGHAFFTAYLLFLVGLSYWIVHARRIVFKVFVASIGVLLSLVTNEHTSFAAVPIIMFLAVIYVQYRSLRWIIFIFGLLGVVPLLLSVSGFADVNAVWRFMYWVGVLKESWENGWFLLGKGFGVQYMPEGSESFITLIDQVSRPENREYQLMTVPPHNGVLTILIYLGLFGVILFIYPYIKIAGRLLQHNAPIDSVVVFTAALGLLALLMSNQFVEVPYTAVIYWIVYGVMLTKI
jgi:hypothetical protein